MRSAAQYEGPDIATVAFMLAERAEAFCRDHLRGGVKVGGRWIAGDVHGAAGQSLSVMLIGSKAGRWKDFSADIQGDLIDLLCHNQNLSKGEAFRRAKQWLGYSDDTHRQSDQRHHEERARKKAAALTDKQAQEEREKELGVNRMWRDTKQADNTVVEAYLRGRGITLAPPAAIRLAPLLVHKPSDRELPCMVAAMFAPRMEDGQDKATMRIVALHRTWLVVDELVQREGERFILHHHVLALGRDAKVSRYKWYDGHSSHDKGKMVWGSTRGAYIPLTAGPTRSVLAISEGIENGLSVAQVNPAWSVWAAYSASNYGGLIIPPSVKRLVLCQDGDSRPARDAAGNIKLDGEGNPIRPADEAIRRAAQLHADVAADDGRRLEVEIWRPAEGKDANDMLREGTL